MAGFLTATGALPRVYRWQARRYDKELPLSRRCGGLLYSACVERDSVVASHPAIFIALPDRAGADVSALAVVLFC